MDQPTKGGHRNRGSLTTASLTLVPLDLKNSEPPTEHVLIEDFRTLRDIGSRKRDDRTLHFRVSDPVEKVLLNDPIFYPFQLLMPAIYTSFRVPRIRSRLSAQQISSVPF